MQTRTSARVRVRARACWSQRRRRCRRSTRRVSRTSCATATPAASPTRPVRLPTAAVRRYSKNSPYLQHAYGGSCQACPHACGRYAPPVCRVCLSLAVSKPSCSALVESVPTAAGPCANNIRGGTVEAALLSRSAASCIRSRSDSVDRSRGCLPGRCSTRTADMGCHHCGDAFRRQSDAVKASRT